MMDGTKRKLIFFILLLSFVVAALGLYSAAKQEDQLVKSQDVVSDLTVKYADLIRSLNRATGVSPEAKSVALAQNTPPWVKLAYNELGTREVIGIRENPRIVDYFKSVPGDDERRDDLDDWASAFVEWSFNQANIAGPKSDDPFAWLEWGKALDRPRPGCVVVFDFSGLRHVGFYLNENSDFVEVLGGNQDDSVSIFRYPRTSALGCRWPKSVP